MSWFPQMSSGSIAQYPVDRVERSRTAVAATGDGRRAVLADPRAASVAWRLEYRGLSEADAAALEAFFAEREGRLGSFGFLDPAANLIEWSEEFDDAAWSRNALLTLGGRVDGPWGSLNGWALTNTGGAPLRMTQTIAGPGGFVYTASVHARGVGGIGLVGGASMTWRAIGTEWSRVEAAGVPGEPATFGVEIAAGASVELFGFQVEAQPGASGYRRTTSRGGVYPDARFDSDELRVIAEGPGSYRCDVRVRARG